MNGYLDGHTNGKADAIAGISKRYTGFSKTKALFSENYYDTYVQGYDQGYKDGLKSK